MRRLREAPPTVVGGVPVLSMDDLATGGFGLPPTDALRFTLDGGSRVVVRPSGTEPKVKCYLQAVVPVTESLQEARATAETRLDAIAADVAAWLG
jgi:phosphomannomutase